MTDREKALLARAAEVAKNARGLSFLMLGACIFSWIAIGTVKDIDLILNRDGATLPIINVALPTVGFFYVAPVLLLAVYVYFHLYLQRLWQTLYELPSWFEDGEPLDRKLFPWLLLGLVRWYKPGMKEPPEEAKSGGAKSGGEDLMGWIGNAAAFVVAWWVAPLTVGVFWLRYWPKHDWTGTSFHTALTMIAFVFGVVSHVWMRSILAKGHARLSDLGKEKSLLTECGLAIVLVGGLALTHWYTLREGPGSKLVEIVENAVPFARELGVADLRRAELTPKPADWAPAETITRDRRTMLRQIPGIDLTGQDFSGALMRDAFLANAQLKESRFDGADLQNAVLEGVDACEAAPHDTTGKLDCGLWARGAILSGVHGDHANLDQADFLQSRMADARFRLSNLRGANFDATTGPIDLEASDASDATFVDAKLAGSRFVEARLRRASFDRSEVRRASFDAADLSDARLTETNAEGARFNRTILTNADATSSRFRGARMENADLSGAVFAKADLYGARLNGAGLQFTVLDGANLRAVRGLIQKQLDRAVGDGHTRLPAGADLSGVPDCIPAPYRTVPHHLRDRVCQEGRKPCLVGTLVDKGGQAVGNIRRCPAEPVAAGSGG